MIKIKTPTGTMEIDPNMTIMGFIPTEYGTEILTKDYGKLLTSEKVSAIKKKISKYIESEKRDTIFAISYESSLEGDIKTISDAVTVAVVDVLAKFDGIINNIPMGAYCKERPFTEKPIPFDNNNIMWCFSIDFKTESALRRCTGLFAAKFREAMKESDLKLLRNLEIKTDGSYYSLRW